MRLWGLAWGLVPCAQSTLVTEGTLPSCGCCRVLAPGWLGSSRLPAGAQMCSEVRVRRCELIRNPKGLFKKWKLTHWFQNAHVTASKLEEPRRKYFEKRTESDDSHRRLQDWWWRHQGGGTCAAKPFSEGLSAICSREAPGLTQCSQNVWREIKYCSSICNFANTIFLERNRFLLLC